MLCHNKKKGSVHIFKRKMKGLFFVCAVLLLFAVAAVPKHRFRKVPPVEKKWTLADCIADNAANNFVYKKKTCVAITGNEKGAECAKFGARDAGDHCTVVSDTKKCSEGNAPDLTYAKVCKAHGQPVPLDAAHVKGDNKVGVCFFSGVGKDAGCNVMYDEIANGETYPYRDALNAKFKASQKKKK